MASRSLISRIAIAVALAGTTGALVVPQVALAAKKAPKPGTDYSEGFRKAAAPIEKAMGDATAGIQGNATPDQLVAAKVKMDAALGGSADAAFATALAAATTNDDKAALGGMMRNYGVISSNQQTLMKGIDLQLASGTLPADQVGKLNFDAGVTAYQNKDYAGAGRYLKASKDAGYKDPQGQLDAVLADAYKRSGNGAAAMAMADQDIAAARAAGGKPSESALRSSLQAAYDAKNAAKSTDLAAELAGDYPSPETWNIAVRIVRDLSSLPPQDNLDLMRLMSRTGAMNERVDYVEYVQNADPRRLPGETLKVIDAGVASGKLQKSDGFVSEMRSMASGRLASDRASLPGLERDARSANANAATVTGAADAFLSYDQPAKAEELYKVALAKPGADKARVLTRLGIAQADQGKFADAQTSFGQVTGPRIAIAKLWTAYATTRSGGGAATGGASPAQ